MFTSTLPGGTNFTDYSDARGFELSEFERSSGGRVEEKYDHTG